MRNKNYRLYYDSRDSTRIFLYLLLFPYLAVFVLYAIYMVIGSTLNLDNAEFMELLPVIMINAVFMQLCLIVVFFSFSYNRRINFVTGTKLNKKPNAWAFAIALCLGFAFMWFSSPLVTLFEQGLAALGFNIDSDLGFPLTNAGNIIFAIVGLGVIPAFIEEFIFRGAILQGLRKHGDWFAIIMSALLFMLMHANIQQTIYQFAFGVLAGWLVIKTGSIWTSIAMHGINNIFVIILQSINEINGTSSESVVLNSQFMWETIIYTLVLVVLLWLGIHLINKIYKKPIKATQNVNAENKSLADGDGSKKMTFKEGLKDYMSDTRLKREGVLGLSLAFILLIINSVAMLM